MRKTLMPFILYAAILASPAQSVENGIRPGLWEMTTTSNLLQLVPHVPPDQMRQLQNLAKEYGIAMPEIYNGAATSKVCITRELAQQEIPPDFYQSQSGCAGRNARRSGNSYSVDLVCAGQELQGNGRAQGTFSSPERFTGRTEFNGTVRGTPVNEVADTSGRWLGVDCGSVKPPQ